MNAQASINNKDNTELLPQYISWLNTMGIESFCSGTTQNHFTTLLETANKTKAALQTTPQITKADKKSNVHNLHAPNLDLFNIPDNTTLVEQIKNYDGLDIVKTATHALAGIYNLPQDDISERILVVQTMPDRQEDLSGDAFSGELSQLAENILKSCGITNYMRCYLSPWRTPGQRSLTAQEQKVCGDALNAIMKIAQPRKVFVFGIDSAKIILSQPNFRQNNMGNEYVLPSHTDSEAEMAVFPLFSLESLINNKSLKRKSWGYIVNWMEKGLLPATADNKNTG